MDETDIRPYSVEDFLANERKKLDEDRKSLQLILTILKEEQQINLNILRDESVQVEFQFNHDKITEEITNPNNVDAPRQCLLYNSQTEKERLAYLFENSPNFLHHRVSPRKRHNRERCRLNKENQDPSYLCPRSRILASKDEITDNSKRNDDEKMVRIWPSSTVFDLDRSLLGLGEHEERRRVFLEKKKQEYAEYLSSLKKNRMLKRTCSRMVDQDVRFGSCIDRENFSPYSESYEDAKWDYRCNRIQQENYRKELDNQIEERKKLEEERKNRERLECERSQFSDMEQRQNVMKRIEEDFHKRLKILNDCKHENETQHISETDLSTSSKDYSFQNLKKTVPSSATRVRENSRESHEPFPKQTIETCSIEDTNAYEKMKKELYRRELDKQMEEKSSVDKDNFCKNQENQLHRGDTKVPLYLKNPFMKQNAESWTIENLEEYQRMKDAVYKKELDKQIREKRERERELKAEADEADRKLDEKLRKEAERNRAESLQEVNIRQDNVLPPESYKSTHSQSSVAMKRPSKSLVKSGSGCSSDGKIHDKTAAKNVSFAPRTFVYSFDNNENLENITTTESQNMTRTDNSIIIEAPYVLAAKNISNSINIIDNCGRRTTKSPTLPECQPIPPNMSKPLPEIANLPIPSAVSMSDQAIQDYFRTNVFSDLSKIRRMLRDRNTNTD